MKAKTGGGKQQTSLVVKPVQTIDVTIDVTRDLTEQETRKMVYDGSLALQYTLFKHAKDQRPKLSRLTGLINKIENRIYQEEIIDQLDNQQLLKLYATANAQVTDSIGFLERLHKIVQDTEDVSKVTNSLNISIDGVLNSADAVRYRSNNIDTARLKNVKEILIRNITGKNTSQDDVIDAEFLNQEEID